jgi:hypothetical protein
MRHAAGTLEQIRIAEPCNASWERMAGDERVRFCDGCRKNVYNLSAMNRAEAEELVREMEGRLCVRFYQRRDGTVLTDNCSVGVRKARAWLSVQLAGIAATFATLFALAPANRPAAMGNPFEREPTPFRILNQEPEATMEQAVQPVSPQRAVMGEMPAPRVVMMGEPEASLEPAPKKTEFTRMGRMRR